MAIIDPENRDMLTPSEDKGQPGACRSCHAPIFWRLTAKGKRAPFDPDGKSHFATCPEAGKWRMR